MGRWGAAARRVVAGVERRRDSFWSWGRESGMLRVVRSWLNWVWASEGGLGWTAGLLDHMQACLIMDFSGGERRS